MQQKHTHIHKSPYAASSEETLCRYHLFATTVRRQKPVTDLRRPIASLAAQVEVLHEEAAQHLLAEGQGSREVPLPLKAPKKMNMT